MTDRLRRSAIRYLSSLGLFLLMLFSLANIWAAVPVMPLEEVRVGARGIGRTVIAGTRIEEFDVEILGIMKNKGVVGDLILIRVSGDVIDRAGGVAQGMSGSPVFIDGRLIGAIGYGWSLTDQRTAMVTPIGDMLKLFDSPVPPSKPALSTRLMAAGFGEAALRFLQTQLKPLNLTPVAVGDPPGNIAWGRLEPGSAVGVQLVRGDVSLGALGTVTYVDGERVLAFGHPFLKRGPTSFLMTHAYIFTTIRGLETSFKLGTTTEAVGTILQDRGAGVAGQMNRFPGIVPLRMKISSQDWPHARDLAVQIVQDEEIMPILATAALLNGVNKAMDRSGSGTATITFEVAARDMPGETYRRTNMFYSPENVAEATLSEFYEFLAYLAANPHQKVTVMDVQAEVSVSPERRTARILSAKPLQASVRPGETVQVEVKLKPYRAEPITRTVDFIVPKGQKAGVLTLSVRGGGFVPLSSLMKKFGSESEAAKPTRKPPKSFEETLKDFRNRDRNNDIVVEIAGRGFLWEEESGGDRKPKVSLTEKEKSARDASSAKPEKPDKSRPGKTPSLLKPDPEERKEKGVLNADFIIEGDSEVSLEVRSAEE